MNSIAVICLTSLILILWSPSISQEYRAKLLSPRPVTDMIFEDNFVRIKFDINKQIDLQVTNKTRHPIEIEWSKASYVDTWNESWSVIHSGVSFTDKDKAVAPTIIAAHARLTTAIIPARYISYSAALRKWQVQDILGGNWKHYEGKVIKLLLPIRARRQMKHYNFVFTVIASPD